MTAVVPVRPVDLNMGGVLTEESFKSVIRQFEPAIKSDQLTRLWFFADLDGSGRIDLFEFMRMLGHWAVKPTAVP
eukprot:Skav209808  [mRNA]  locus=scaffold2415:102855:103937:+ [translate_table: standard]